MRSRLASTVAICIGLASLFFGPTALAQGAIKAKHGDWETRCESPPGASREQCAIVLSVVAEDRPSVVLVLIVLNTADHKAHLMRIIAPLGVLLPSGVGLKIDGEDLGHINFIRCLPNGCIAEAEIKDKLLEKMENGHTATLGIFQSPEEGIGVTAPLEGFKDAYEQLP
jgi:invasion protein IalB